MAFANPYEVTLKKLSKAGVRYVMIGVSAINFYADEPEHMFSTQDCDVLVKPDPKNLLSALRTLKKEGYDLESNREPLVGVDLWLAGKIIEHSAVITARRKEGLHIDIVLDGGKIPYAEWNRRKRVFTIGRTKIYVGSLPHLIRAKENSNREKDRIFLALYKIQLAGMLKDAHPNRKR